MVVYLFQDILEAEGYVGQEGPLAVGRAAEEHYRFSPDREKVSLDRLEVVVLEGGLHSHRLREKSPDFGESKLEPLLASTVPGYKNLAAAISSNPLFLCFVLVALFLELVNGHLQGIFGYGCGIELFGCALGLCTAGAALPGTRQRILGCCCLCHRDDRPEGALDKPQGHKSESRRRRRQTNMDLQQLKNSIKPPKSGGWGLTKKERGATLHLSKYVPTVS